MLVGVMWMSPWLSVQSCSTMSIREFVKFSLTGLVPTREQGLCLDVSRLLPPHEHGLCLDVNSVCTYTWTGLVPIREQGLCEQGLCPHDRKLSGGMFVAMSGKLFEFSEVSGVTGRRASSVFVPLYRLIISHPIVFRRCNVERRCTSIPSFWLCVRSTNPVAVYPLSGGIFIWLNSIYFLIIVL